MKHASESIGIFSAPREKMPSTVVYAKTAKGRAEIEARQHGLPARARRLLILVDARRTVPELATLSALGNDVHAPLGDLLDGGFICPVGGASAGSDQPRSPPRPSGVREQGSAPALPQPTPEGLSLAKQIMLETADAHFGLLGADLKRRIAAAHDAVSVAACVARWNLAMRESNSGRPVADDFLQKIRLALG